ncbi:MAG TPA: HD-GYP domain-containing protein [Candidatus Saccharimonadales bacterium]|nr:HD-GYP domain-containing protein [Candidatus Saccharimonadales bacterium]
MSTAVLERGPEAATHESRLFASLARELLHQLSILIRNSYLHPLSNAVFVEPLTRAQNATEHILEVERSLKLELVGAEFFANGKHLRMEIRSLHAYRYMREELTRAGLGGLEFGGAPSRAALSGLLQALRDVRSKPDPDVETFNEMLVSQGIHAFRGLPPREASLEPGRQAAIGRRQRAIQAYEQVLDFIRDSMMNHESPAQIDLRRAKRSVQRLVDLSFEEGEGFSLAGMAAIKGHDSYTFNHMVNVCILAIAFGQRLGLKRRDLARLGLGALYHDMGKLHIPLEILNKPATLTEEEWAVMGNHTVYAARTLFPLIEQDPDTITRILAALQHHLNYDGSGYPKLRILKTQSLIARIIAIADTFDAMTTKRLYQRRFLPDEAMKALVEMAGMRYDPVLVKAFINCMGVFPVGSAVLLTTGEIAVVIESNADPDRVHQPRVRVVTDAAQQAIQPAEADLTAPAEAQRQIVRCVDAEEFGINAASYAF